jgi:hypothetical protein
MLRPSLLAFAAVLFFGLALLMDLADFTWGDYDAFTAGDTGLGLTAGALYLDFRGRGR